LKNIFCLCNIIIFCMWVIQSQYFGDISLFILWTLYSGQQVQNIYYRITMLIEYNIVFTVVLLFIIVQFRSNLNTILSNSYHYVILLCWWYDCEEITREWFHCICISYLYTRHQQFKHKLKWHTVDQTNSLFEFL